jgi:flagellar FliL protein
MAQVPAIASGLSPAGAGDGRMNNVYNLFLLPEASPPSISRSRPRCGWGMIPVRTTAAHHSRRRSGASQCVEQETTAMSRAIRTLRLRYVIVLFTAVMAALPLTLRAAGGEAATLPKEYVDLRPSFVTNYGGPGPIHYLKIDIALRLGKRADAAALVDHNMPYIRHILVMLLSRQTDASVGSMEGKEKLRADALAAVKKMLQEETGREPVEDLLFTNFVVQ